MRSNSFCFLPRLFHDFRNLWRKWSSLTIEGTVIKMRSGWCLPHKDAPMYDVILHLLGRCCTENNRIPRSESTMMLQPSLSCFRHADVMHPLMHWNELASVKKDISVAHQ